MQHPRTWYVVADGGQARFLIKREADNAFDTERDLASADIHLHTHELGAERPGRGHESANSAHHAVEPREDLHRAAKRTFVDEVAAALNEANAQNAFDRLFLVAPAHALGQLHQALDAATKAKVAAQLQKDLVHVPNTGLAAHLADLGGV